MEKKFSFSDKPTMTKIIYGVVVAILCITAIIVGIVAASSRNDTELPGDDPSLEEPAPDNNDGDGNKEENKPKPLAFISPIVGTVMTGYDASTPVFNHTLGAWRVHKGLDISADEGAAVYASERGTVKAIYSDPMLGYTVELSHEGGIVTRYSNLANDGKATIKVGDEVASGDCIGYIGDTSKSELADEPHLHFELLVGTEKRDPLDYLTEESKKTSLGIE